MKSVQYSSGGFLRYGVNQVYIIRSKKSGKYYTGMSGGVFQRLHFHNLGKNTSTKGGVPWEIVWVSEFMIKTQAL